jgi:hypothetical protein
MKYVGRVALVLLATAGLAGPAFANTCQADRFMCATTMPVGGYCECTSHGTTQGGTVVAAPMRGKVNSTAAGCGAHPDAPGCH